jgi:pyrroloquinoline quinone biosynthesis protein D
MSARLLLSADAAPRLAPHMRLRHDRTRDAWAIQAPERTFLLDEIARDIITRCDGRTSLAEIIESLCEGFPDAPREVVAGDVTALLQDFTDKGVITT